MQDRGKLIQPRPRTLTQRCSPPPPSPPRLPQIGRNWLRLPRPGWDILAVEWEAGCQEVGCQSVLRQVGPVDQVDQVDQVDRVGQVGQVGQAGQAGQFGQGGRREPVPHGCNSSLVSHTLSPGDRDIGSHGLGPDIAGRRNKKNFHVEKFFKSMPLVYEAKN